jgi:hypothetical protein
MLPIVPFTCAICAAQIDPLRCGKCVQCGKIACRRHFLRGWWKRAKRVCSRCLRIKVENENIATKK